MGCPPIGISEEEWVSWPAGARDLIVSEQQEIEQLRRQLPALATKLASLRERVGRSSRHSSRPPSCDGPGFKPPEQRKGSGRKRGGPGVTPGPGLRSCRWSGSMQWWNTSLMPAGAAACCWTEIGRAHV